ncbi:radial spoke head protein 3 homolog isoform X1 [Onychostruthus taczanowskii]|uniref:radial spoke head protein 3 homolog isoform X1 n=1 Tax=Onychostruthus taczanowskii TaxID=356909 RepID=UPI001B800BDE|nr:radial spoke head protein 3 homolog isoform X1 [Onychostruthus taczanowskii]
MPPRRECRCPAVRCPSAFPRLSPRPSSLPEERSPRRLAFLPPAGGKAQAALSVLCRREKAPVRYGNIMIDPRVVRGNVLSFRPPPPQSTESHTLEVKRQRRAQKQLQARKFTQEQVQPGTPEPVEGREHVYVQTELYLEEISDRIIEVDGECQTDEFLDRPPTPLFIPAKSGKDVATQIKEGELFDFDIEVEPILEVLVGKTVEQALLEVMEEEELAQLWSHQRAFAELRNAEFAELQRLEEQDRRIREEKECRRLEHLEKLRKQKETAEKIAARAFAQRYLADLIPSVFNNLHDSGFFYDPIERDIETEFLPWLMSEVEETLQKKVLGRTMVDSLIRTVVEKRLDEFSHPPPSAQTKAPAEEPGATDAAPKVSGEAGAADQPVAEEEPSDSTSS